MVRNQKSIKTGSEVQRFFERKDHNSKVYKDRARIGRIRSEFQCLKNWAEFQCLEG